MALEDCSATTDYAKELTSNLSDREKLNVMLETLKSLNWTVKDFVRVYVTEAADGTYKESKKSRTEKLGASVFDQEEVFTDVKSAGSLATENNINWLCVPTLQSELDILRTSAKQFGAYQARPLTFAMEVF